MRLSILLLFCTLALTACYRPLYGEKSLGQVSTPQEAKLNDVFIGSIENEEGQKLRNLLIDRLYRRGRPEHARQRLDAHLTVAEEHLGLQKNGTTSLARLDIRADYSLNEAGGGKRLFSASAHSIVTYDLLDDQYATLNAREDAYTRALTEIADRITTRLLVYFDEGK